MTASARNPRGMAAPAGPQQPTGAGALRARQLHAYQLCVEMHVFPPRLRYYAKLPPMWMTAFGTSSSAATLSTTISVLKVPSL